VIVGLDLPSMDQHQIFTLVGYSSVSS